MKKLVLLGLIVSGLSYGASSAQAGFSFSISLGHDHYRPPVYVAPPPVCVAPAPVYVAPRPVYVAPPPVYVAPRLVYVTPPPVCYPPVTVYEPYGYSRGWGRHGYARAYYSDSAHRGGGWERRWR